MNLLSELKIRCEFFDRGCGKFVQLEDLKRHVADCGFAPAVCSNEGCQLEVNKQDLLHHETAVCELRRVKCYSCNDIRREMDTMKVNLAAINEKLDKNEKNVLVVVKNVATKVELVQEQLNKQEESNCLLRADNVEMKRSLNEIMRQLERMTQLTSHEVQAEEMKKEIAEGGEDDRESMVIVAGGRRPGGQVNSVEMFNLATRTWTQLQPMRENREGPSSVSYNNQVFVIGGCVSSMEKLSLNAVQAFQSIRWENVPAELPGRLFGHGSVVYNGRLMVTGGYICNGGQSDSITEISLVPPCTSKQIATMPRRRYYHGVAIFGDKILIDIYDITRNQFQELAPLPYRVYEMATVKWDDDNVMIMGGADINDQPLNQVLMYNINTQKSHELPNMKYKRKGCVAAVVRDNVIVMGGLDERGNVLKSVEGFRFDRNSWEELPSMHEARLTAAAVVC